uniref:Uncharacterized protein n=1 Tax=Opuntia streptacantha TaxID=393608 RepID=A0A7C9DJN2_OPUST
MLPSRQTLHFQRRTHGVQIFFASSAGTKKLRLTIPSIWNSSLVVQLLRRSFLNYIRLEVLCKLLQISLIQEILRRHWNTLTKLCLFFPLHVQRLRSSRSNCCWQQKIIQVLSLRLVISSKRMRMTWMLCWSEVVPITI